MPLRRWFLAGLALGPLGLRAQAQEPSAAPYFLLTQQARTAFTVEGAGARAMGMGGAFTAVADDATAVSYNPAGLAQLVRPEVSAVAQGFTRNLDFKGFTGSVAGVRTAFEDTYNKDRDLALSFASVAVPWKLGGHNLVLLLSYQKVFDFTYRSDVSYLASTNGGTTSQAIGQTVGQTGGVSQYSLALGAEVSSRILLGLAVNRWTGHSGFTSFSQRTTTGVDHIFDSNLSQESTFQGLNATLGLIWRSEWLNLGFTYRTPFQATYVFTNTYTYLDNAVGIPATTTSGATSTAINWPETLTWGLGLHLGSRTLVTADWSLTPWSRARFHGGSLDGLNWFDLQSRSQTPKATDLKVGVEWLALVRPGLVVPLRAGAFRQPQPLVDPLTGAQRILEGWTVGAGVKLRNLTLDMALKATHDHRYISRYNTDAPIGGVASTAYGMERLEEYRLYLSCIYQFETGPVHRALAWIFG
ncbi:hypothetical protein METEAL_04480 [Mesoterricola silvestris]|uniref:PorV/PorQ family protein n=1 Tax=Mesoterricola silvestris TaxID=2927979 RepID=A0AA48GHV8_9BACT|nr:hypothetical protein METEAL_04480 [Mesoterricola silvestris]